MVVDLAINRQSDRSVLANQRLCTSIFVRLIQIFQGARKVILTDTNNTKALMDQYFVAQVRICSLPSCYGYTYLFCWLCDSRLYKVSKGSACWKSYRASLQSGPLWRTLISAVRLLITNQKAKFLPAYAFPSFKACCLNR